MRESILEAYSRILRANLSEILLVNYFHGNYKFFHGSTLTYSDKIQTWVPEVWL